MCVFISVLNMMIFNSVELVTTITFNSKHIIWGYTISITSLETISSTLTLKQYICYIYTVRSLIGVTEGSACSCLTQKLP